MLLYSPVCPSRCSFFKPSSASRPHQKPSDMAAVQEAAILSRVQEALATGDKTNMPAPAIVDAIRTVSIPR